MSKFSLLLTSFIVIISLRGLLILADCTHNSQTHTLSDSKRQTFFKIDCNRVNFNYINDYLLHRLKHSTFYKSRAAEDYEFNNYNEYNYNEVFKLEVCVKNSAIPILETKISNSSDIIKFELFNMKISMIVPTFFHGWMALEELKINHNEIKEIDNGVFVSLESLKILNLRRNSIEKMAEYVFSGNTKLTTVDLSENKLVTLPENLFRDQTKLFFVDISKNLLINVDDVFTTQPITFLYLSQNNIQKVNLTKFLYRFLREMDFSNNSIETFELHRTSNVEKLDLSNNKILFIDAEVHSLLNISNNSISTLHQLNFGSSLKILDVSYNNLTSLNSDMLEDYTGLTSFFLHHNKIQSIAINSFNKFENVRTLDLSFNEIKKIPFGLFNNLKNLENLNFADNNMVLDFHTLSMLFNLTTLNLRNNKVLNFDEKIILNSMRKLTEITLGHYTSNCSELSGLVRELQRNQINIVPGNTTNSSNVLGISCEEHLDLGETDIFFKRGNTQSNTSLKMDLNNSTLIKYLNVVGRKTQNIENTLMPLLTFNFSETNFYKHMQRFVNLTNDTLKEANEFFQRGFLNTSFVKYFNSFTHNLTNNNFPHLNQNRDASIELLLKKIESTFKNLTVKIQVPFAIPSQNVTTDNEIVGEHAVPSSLVSLVKENNDYSTKSIENNLIVNNLLLLTVLFCLLGMLWKKFNYIFKRPKNNVNSNNVREQLQLIET
ncbi:hypothetical protein ABEB36_008076 [Hypothenemus hampei]|uniref:Uncharacterized protein n=1 Tax=Hypothenemus hampei TaxID=57062 RepID=A0ABD1EL64_HYPHA